MLNDILVALIYDFLKLLSKNKEFFNLSNEKKSEILKTPNLFPETIIDCMLELNEQTLAAAIREILEYVSVTRESRVSFSSPIAKGFANFCVMQIPKDLDNYSSDQPDQYSGRFGKHLGVFYASAVEKQIIDQIQTFISLVFQSPFIVVQAPILLDKSQKDDIRKELQKQYPHSVPIFSVNKNLIGGLRIFIDGKTQDYSWISKINKFTSLKLTN